MIDGPTLLAEALDAGVELLDVIAEPGAPADLLARCPVVHEVLPGSLAKVVDTQTPQPVAAIAKIPADPTPNLPPTGERGLLPFRGQVRLAVVAVGLNDPGNAGSLLRSADAAGADLMVFCDDSVDPYNPKCVRASAGSLFRVPVVRATTSESALGALKAAGIRSLGLAARGGAVYDTVDYAVPSAIVLGSEAHGLPATVESLVDALVTIPMQGPIESLNVGMAGTIVCFEALRQRRNRDKDHRDHE